MFQHAWLEGLPRSRGSIVPTLLILHDVIHTVVTVQIARLLRGVGVVHRCLLFPRSSSLTLKVTKNTYRTNQFHSKGQSALRAGSC